MDGLAAEQRHAHPEGGYVKCVAEKEGRMQKVRHRE